MSVYIIAEIGVNHNGDTDLAMKMVDAAKKAGADAVKFQTFSAQRLASQSTPKVKYQIRTTGESQSHKQMLQDLELSEEQHILLKKHCDSLKIDFLSTPYDVESARFLREELNVLTFKTASADIVDLPLHKYIAENADWAIVSTGMATLGEVEEAVSIYEGSKSMLTLLHCVSNYPCSDSSLNMLSMGTLQKCFNVPVGYSDHSVGSVAAISSVALGGTVIEKHFTLDKSLPGPDHQASIEPGELLSLVTDIRRVENMLGSSIKKPQLEELEMASVSRKSVFLKRDISAGEKISFADLTCKRPGTGLAPKYLEIAEGSFATKDLKADDLLEFGDFRVEA